eukprot:840861-Rhodomonas_salina.1
MSFGGIAMDSKSFLLLVKRSGEIAPGSRGTLLSIVKESFCLYARGLFRADGRTGAGGRADGRTGGPRAGVGNPGETQLSFPPTGP